MVLFRNSVCLVNWADTHWSCSEIRNRSELAIGEGAPAGLEKKEVVGGGVAGEEGGGRRRWSNVGTPWRNDDERDVGEGETTIFVTESYICKKIDEVPYICTEFWRTVVLQTKLENTVDLVINLKLIAHANYYTCCMFIKFSVYFPAVINPQHNELCCVVCFVYQHKGKKERCRGTIKRLIKIVTHPIMHLTHQKHTPLNLNKKLKVVY